MLIQVKGIYSTGLIKLLLEKGYELTKLSEKQKERFNIFREDEPDVIISDLKDKTGIRIIGKNLNKLIEDLKEIFWDSFFIKVYEKNIKEGKYVKILEKGLEFENISEEKKIKILEKALPLIQNIGILFKKTCENADIDEIINEIKELLEKPAEKIEKWYVILGYNSKKILDEYRGKVIKTIENHHVYRRVMSDIIDFSEILDCDVSKAIKKYIVEKIKEKGIIERYHKMPNGKTLKYIEVVQDVKLIDNKIYLKTIRLIKPGGYYDGLKIPKEEGDYAITEYIEGNWYFVISYYNKEGKLKGRYININTPIEITQEYIYYLDLVLDVIEINNNRFVVDEEELENYKKSGILSERLSKKVKEIVEELLSK